ncbi:MAG: amino acid ABC transporter permease [Chloroflexi bacterium]|nr:MAG: amino acid ABC transporter permease [Chloroflexota bacterium]TMF37352.1 MAG: amino acid ABC transporter permease [Chloroflexota bacterium]
MDAVQSILPYILPGVLVTLEISVGAWVVSAALGLVLAVMRDTRKPLITLPASISVEVVRAVPQLVVLYIVFFGLGTLGINLDSLTAAIVGLGISDAVFTAEYYRAGFLTVAPKQRDAGLSLGLKPLQVARYVIIPQTIPFVVPPLLNSFVGLMKSATLASAVGAPEILYGGRNYMETTGHVAPAAVAIMGLYIIATVPLTRAVRSLEKRVQMRTRV